MVEIAEMVADEGVPIPAQGERSLQLAADGQDRRRTGHRQRDRRRRIAARATHDPRRTVNHPRHRIVDPARNVAIVHQKDIGDTAEPRAGVSLGYELGGAGVDVAWFHRDAQRDAFAFRRWWRCDTRCGGWWWGRGGLDGEWAAVMDTV